MKGVQSCDGGERTGCYQALQAADRSILLLKKKRNLKCYMEMPNGQRGTLRFSCHPGYESYWSTQHQSFHPHGTKKDGLLSPKIIRNISAVTSSGRLPWVSSPHRLKQQIILALSSSNIGGEISFLPADVQTQPVSLAGLCGRLRAPVCAAGVQLASLSGAEAFPLLCRKQLGLKRLLCGQESPNSVPGHWVCRLLCLRDGGRVFPRAAEILVTVISNKCQSNL